MEQNQKQLSVSCSCFSVRTSLFMLGSGNGAPSPCCVVLSCAWGTRLLVISAAGLHKDFVLLKTVWDPRSFLLVVGGHVARKRNSN